VASAHAQRGGDRDLQHRAGQGDALAHFQQVVEREVQADAEHQQHHADLGQLRRPAPRRPRSRAWPGRSRRRRQIADQRRQFQAHGEHAEQQAERFRPRAAAMVVIRLMLWAHG
jgi:hypothetical protein